MLALVVTSLGAMTWIGLSVVGTGPIGPPAKDVAHAASAVVIFAGLALASAVLAGAVRMPGAPAGFRGRLARLAVWLLPTAGLILLAICVVLMDDGLRTSQEAGWPYIRIFTWVSLGTACLYVLRPRRAHMDGLVDADRALRVALPAMLVIAIAATPVTAGLSPWYVSLLLLGVFSVVMDLGISAIIGILFALTVKGLEATRDRGKLVSARVGTNRRTLLAVIGVKLVALLLIWAAWHAKAPGDTVLDLSLPSCVMATAAAAIVVILFAIDGHVRLSTSDHEVVSRYSGIVLGGALSFGFSAALLIGLAASAIPTRPMSLIGAALLLALAVWLARARRLGAVVAAYVTVMVAGAVSAIALASRPVVAYPVFDGGDESMQILRGAAIGIAIIGVGIAVIWILVACIVSRRFGWLVYVGQFWCGRSSKRSGVRSHPST